MQPRLALAPRVSYAVGRRTLGGGHWGLGTSVYDCETTFSKPVSPRGAVIRPAQAQTCASTRFSLARWSRTHHSEDAEVVLGPLVVQQAVVAKVHAAVRLAREQMVVARVLLRAHAPVEARRLLHRALAVAVRHSAHEACSFRAHSPVGICNEANSSTERDAGGRQDCCAVVS